MTLKGNDLFTDEGCWLFEKDSVYREFTPSVTLAKPENIIYWGECTNAEKEQWEDEHRQPSPEPTLEPSES